MATSELLRRIPQVDAVLRSDALAEARALLGDAIAERLARDGLAEARAGAERGIEPPDASAIAAAASARAQSLHGARLRRVINATGVILHTNLGRAPLPPTALDAVRNASASTNVEYDLDAGERSGRAPLAAFLAAALTGAEAAHVVNNNAASLLLILAALAKGREVIVSRGEMIEIGGEFRLPSIMEASGAILKETGTTNRTHARDYRAALNERTGMILTVHPSNFRVVGFTTAPSLTDLAAIAREAGVPLVHDTGSGLLEPDERLAGEPDATSSLKAGADLVCFSGDKLLGGPQSGIIVGRKDLVERCKRHPIARAVRADKLTLAALEATLLAHARGEHDAIPVPHMIRRDADGLRARSAALAARIPGAAVTHGESVVGGGSSPGDVLAGPVLRIACQDPEKLATRLRRSNPPIIVRIDSGAVVLDLRTVEEHDDPTVLAALTLAAGNA